MILPDSNLLLYAVNQTSPDHRAAKRWLEESLNGAETVAFAWIVLLSFIRISTSRRVFPAPLTVPAALETVADWLNRPNVTTVDPGPNHLRVLRDLLAASGTGGNLTSDAHLAALAIEHGGVVHSADADYARFRGLHWLNPLGDK